MNNRPALGVSANSKNRAWFAGLLLLATGLMASVVSAQTAPGTVIQNVATVSFANSQGNPQTIASNAVRTVVASAPTRSTLSILRIDGAGAGSETTMHLTQCRSGNTISTLPPPQSAAGTIIDLSRPVALATTASLHGGEATFLRLVDADQNLDAAAIDVVELRVSTPAGDSEVLRLAETGPDTGIFAGYIQTRAAAASAGNCVLEVARNAALNSFYVDPLDARDVSNASALVDPYGLVFDSATGAPVDGARVRLIDNATGALASVFGDDGASRYPAEMVTGEQVTDSGGSVYSLPAGVFRFPLIATGSYRLEVDPPAGHAFPSALSIGDLANSPGGPYRLQDGSFGRTFAVEAGPTIAIDVPVDAAATQLFMRKSTITTVAAVGDFVQYSLVAENTSGNAAIPGVSIVDRLPDGARYRPGSARIEGAVATDPSISSDGRTLTFTHGRLGAGQRVEIRYVVEITVAARGKQLVNSAQARGPDGTVSNTAQATIQLREELFRERAILMGRVTEGDCSALAHRQQGVRGVRVYLEDGRYSVTDDDGKYHFDDVTPGSHVVQMDTVTIPSTHLASTCPGRVRNAGSAYSQFVDVRGGALWRSDFVLQRKQPAKGEVTLQFQSRAAAPSMDEPFPAVTGSGRTQTEEVLPARPESIEGLSHTATLNVTGLAIDNAQIMAVLADGLAYVPGSAHLNSKSAVDPTRAENVLIFKLGTLPADVASTLTFDTRLNEASSGGMTVKALARFDTPAAKNQATVTVENVALRGHLLHETASYRFAPRSELLDTPLQPADREPLDRIVDEWRGVTHLRLSVTGHTDTALVAASHSVASADPQALALARADAVAKYLADGLGIDSDSVSVAADAAAAVDEQRALHGRVDVAIEGLRVKAAGGLSLHRADAISPAVATLGLLDPAPVAAAPVLVVKESSARGMDIEQVQPGVDWVSPAQDELPAIPSLSVAIRHLPTQRLELAVNGTAVSALNFDGVTTNAAGTVALSRWRGVDVRNGENRLTARVLDDNGQFVTELQRDVHYAGGAVRAELDRAASSLVADGTTHPVIALRMVDAYGRPARPGTLGGWSISEPYRSWWEVESRDDNKLVAVGTRSPTFSVDADGIARLELEPTSQAGTAVVRLRLNERQEQEIRVWLEPRARDWILVGLAEGTSAYKAIRQNMQSAEDAGLEEGYTTGDRVAFFAKGAIKGDTLLTMAYDSARDHEAEKDRLLGTIDPNRFYTLYGDATEQRFEAATTEKLYLKMERRQFAALFGGFTTGMTVTELSRYSRTFNGLKAEYAGERFGYTAFAAESQQGYVKDELPGDGTSGLYRLSRRPLIVNSDRIRVEVRDRFHSEVVIESRDFTRYIDYSIDYLNGTVFFKQPVPSRDAGFNPVVIVAEYEVLSGGKSQVTAGGRGSMQFAGDRMEVGTTYLQEGAIAGDSRLVGTDLRWQIAASTELRAEVARSESDDPTATAQAMAYLTQVEHVTESLDARLYLREQEGGFGLGQQMTSEDGTRKVGADARYNITERFALEGETYRQQMLASGAQRDYVSAEVRRESDDYTVGVGARHVSDTGLSDGDRESQQAFVNGSLDLFRDLITLRASQDLPLGGKNASVDFPARSLIGVDYHWRASTSFFAEYEHADGDDFDADMTRLGVRTSPWERAQIQSSMSQQATEYGPRVFANFGLMQGWKASERWDLDVGVDRSRTISGTNVSPFNAKAALSSGSLNGDYLAAFAGATFRGDFWTFTSRLENRHSDQEERRVFSGGFYREPIAGHAFAMSSTWFDSRFATGADTMASEMQLAWAYRPATSAWIVLNRLDLQQESQRDLRGEFESARLVNNLNSNWQLNPWMQLGLQLGARYVRSTFDDERYSGLSSLYGVDLRHDLTDGVDVGLHGTLLGSLESDVSETAVGVDVGYAVAKNIWISIGYNWSGFRDDDFEASRYTAQGPFIKFRVKADQDTFRDLSLDALRPGHRNGRY
ncbi:OmpA family protein [Povalibacter sp.]|uniref:OmpA family protein n=1 Tax=Povalibacter sp. TaxID=1962978 RepID=UPI002F3EE794